MKFGGAAKKVDDGVSGFGGAVNAVPVAGIPLYGEENAATRKFVINGFQDVWAAVLFILVIFATFIWGCVNYSSNLQAVSIYIANSTSNSTTYESPGYNQTLSSGSLVGIIFLIVFLSSITALGSLAVLCRWPKQSIIGGNVAIGVLLLISAIISFASGPSYLFSAIIMLLLGIWSFVWIYLVRSRIPFSAALLKVSTELVKRYKATIAFNFVLIFAFNFFALFWASAAFPAFNRSAQGAAQGADGFLVVLFLLIVMWASQVSLNVMHTTASGLAATWYYVGSAQMPVNPTVASFKRATTTSFGSICFGSLLVAIIKVIRYLVRQALQHENEFVRCIAQCVLGCIEAMMQFFNTYAFVHVAIYGCGYVEAARRTWDLIKQCFWAQYFNDALVGTTLTMVAFAAGCFAGVVAGVAMQSVALGLLVFMIALNVNVIILRSVDSIVVSIFVCFAETPDALAVSSPELHTLLMATDNGASSRV